jgi:hypothetical protein
MVIFEKDNKFQKIRGQISKVSALIFCGIYIVYKAMVFLELIINCTDSIIFNDMLPLLVIISIFCCLTFNKASAVENSKIENKYFYDCEEDGLNQEE